MLSKTSKLDGIGSWSLPAVSTCPGARDPATGELVPVCQGCYATEGRYRFPNVKAARDRNRWDWREDDWVDRMVAALNNERYFRWFDSGDIYHLGLAAKIYQVIARTPWCNHWLPTRSYKVPALRRTIRSIARLPNVVVRYSGDDLDSLPTTRGHAAIVVSDPDNLPEGVTLCGAYRNKPAACNGCRACWDKDVPTIAYPAHGQKVRTVIKNSPTAKAVS